MTQRVPTGPEREALTLLSVTERYRTELPTFVVNECLARGWVRDDDQGFLHITDDGRKARRSCL